MGGFNLEDNLRAATGQEPWEPMWDPPQPDPLPISWKPFAAGAAAIVVLLGGVIGWIYLAH